jgi:hypothetical protein
MSIKMFAIVPRCLIVGGEQILQHIDRACAAMSGG